MAVKLVDSLLLGDLGHALLLIGSVLLPPSIGDFGGSFDIDSGFVCRKHDAQSKIAIYMFNG